MIRVAEEIKKILQSQMVKSLINADTQLIDQKHSGKFISNLTYDVNHITNMLSTAILSLFKDSLTLFGLLISNVLSELEIIIDCNNYDTYSWYGIKNSW